MDYITAISMPRLHKTLFASLMPTKIFAQKNKKNQTKLKILMKWYVVGKYGFDFCDQQPKIYKKETLIIMRGRLYSSCV